MREGGGVCVCVVGLAMSGALSGRADPVDGAGEFGQELVLAAESSGAAER